MHRSNDPHRSQQLFLAEIEAFDPAQSEEQGSDYAGEIGLCCLLATDVREAFLAISDAVSAEGATIKEIGFLGPPENYEGDPSVFNATLKALSDAALRTGKLAFSDIIIYGSEQ